MPISKNNNPIKGVSSKLPWFVLAVVLAADVLDLLDATITNIAAHTIATDLGGGESFIQWLGASYALALGILLVVGGRLGDKFGQRRIFLTGLAGFTIASIACALALDPTMMIVSRLIQGAFGALLIPQGFGILGSVFPREQLGKAYSFFGPTIGLSAVFGPIVAGLLIHANLFNTGWRSMFLINILLGGAAFVAGYKLLPKTDGDRSIRIDVLGSGLLAGAMLGMLGGFISGSSAGWPLSSIMLVTCGLVLFGLFAWRQKAAIAPLIQPSLFKNRGFTSGLLLGLAFFAAVSGLLYVISLFIQEAFHLDALGTALGIVPIALGIVISSIACYQLVSKLGRTLVFAGLLVTLLGTGILAAVIAFAGPTTIWALTIPTFIVGLGMGTCFATIYDVTIGDISHEEAGSAGGALTAIQQLANGLGAALVTTVYFKLLAAANPKTAMLASLAVVGAVALVSCGLTWLLPRKAPAQHH